MQMKVRKVFVLNNRSTESVGRELQRNRVSYIELLSCRWCWYRIYWKICEWIESIEGKWISLRHWNVYNAFLTFQLDGCANITGSTLHHIGSNCVALKSIDLSSTSGLLTGNLKLFTNSLQSELESFTLCKSLSNQNLNNNLVIDIHPEGLYPLSKCTSLKCITLRECGNVNKSLVIHLVEQLHQLLELDVRGCWNLTLDDIMEIKGKKGSLNIWSSGWEQLNV